MTGRQAEGIWKVLMAAYPNQVLESPTQALYLAHLEALAWRDGYTESVIRTMLASRASAFMPSVGELVAAAGVGPEAAYLLVQAIREKRELVPDLASRTGWAVGVAIRALPKARVSLPDPRTLPPVRPESEFTDEERSANRRRLGGLFKELMAKNGRTG